MNNILNAALKVIPRTPDVYYIRFREMVIDEIGNVSPSYDDPVLLRNAIIQPVDTKTLHLLSKQGVQPIRNMRIAYISSSVTGTNDKITNDIILYENKKWNVIDISKWFNYNGWSKLIIAEIRDE